MSKEGDKKKKGLKKPDKAPEPPQNTESTRGDDAPSVPKNVRIAKELKGEQHQ